MAHRLARVFKNSPEYWLNLQQAVDIWDTYVTNGAKYRGITEISSTEAPDPVKLP